MTVITIGIIRVLLLQTTPVGNQIRRYMIHVQQVGVFRTEKAPEYGTQQDLRKHHMTVQTKALISASAVHPLHGILLRVIATAAMGHWAMSATTATIGQLLLTATTHSACTSSTMALSVRRDTSIGRTASRSVVSKNQND